MGKNIKADEYITQCLDKDLCFQWEVYIHIRILSVKYDTRLEMHQVVPHKILNG